MSRSSRPLADEPTLIWAGKPERAADFDPKAMRPVERVGRPLDGEPSGGLLLRGDNLDAARALLAEYAGKVDLVYLDPPFATGSDFVFTSRGAVEARVAYSDQHGGMAAYLSAMLERLWLVRDLLSERGTLFLHCDWHASHLLRCLLDEVFGKDAFKNEIVWRYRRWPAKTRVFQRMHDVLLWYGKTASDEHAFQPQFEPLAASTVATWGTKKQVANFSSGRRKPSQTDDETPGAPMSDVWEIGIIAPIAHERVGYPTQKPEALLRRIIESASRPGDRVLDLFAGSGTTLVVAEKLGRRWIGCDAGALAVHLCRKRLIGAGAKPFTIASVGDAAASELPRPAATIDAVVERDLFGAPRAVALRHVAFEGEAPTALRVRGRMRAADWSDLVDYWALDWDAGTRPFESRWQSFRATSRAPLSLRAELPALPEGARIAIQVVDAFGTETLQRL